MAFSRDEQRAALLADFARWQARERSPFEGSRAGITHASEDREYMRGFGMIPQSESKRKLPRREPRLTRAESTSDCVVTTRDGNRYTIKRGARNFDGTRKRATIDVDTLNKLDEARKHKVTAADLAAIGNVD